jgi:predicted component of type VI protein secretion system
MKLSLVVTSPGKGEGKIIPITLSQFLIGRDPQCHLRPASPIISKRHCALLVRDGKVFLRDFDSTNGTLVNDEPIKGEQELHNDDRLSVGPLSFRVKIEAAPPVNKPTPVPPPAAAAAANTSDDESIAAMLLSLQEEGETKAAGPVGNDGVPQGSTVLDIPAPLQAEANANKEESPGPKKKEPPKPTYGNTSTAAKAILEKYTRRQRS